MELKQAITMLTALLGCEEHDLNPLAQMVATKEQVSAAYRELIYNGNELNVDDLWYELTKQIVYSVYNAEFVDAKLDFVTRTHCVEIRLKDALSMEDFTHWADAFVTTTGIPLTITK